MKRNTLIPEEFSRLGHLSKAITLGLAAAGLFLSACTSHPAPADPPPTQEHAEAPAQQPTRPQQAAPPIDPEPPAYPEAPKDPGPPEPNFAHATNAPPAPENHERDGRCDAKLHPNQHDSVLKEVRGHKYIDDFYEKYPAEAITVSHTPVDATKEFRADGRNILFYTGDHDVVVNGALISPLEVAHATSMSKGDEAVVGTLSTAGAKMDGLSWVEFLIAADAIQTWMHIEANLCVTIEKATAEAFMADVQGTHIYFTNERNEDKIHFAVKIDGAGVITVVGR